MAGNINILQPIEGSPGHRIANPEDEEKHPTGPDGSKHQYTAAD